ncbi:MAG: GspE/PulE family protein [Patescibacteria group bacterium]|nr:GspE/PulE family protein [Patescibacteria group bacterium]
MKISTKDLRAFLVDSDFISEKKFAEAEKESEETKKELLEVLVDRNLIKEDQLGQVLSTILDIPFIEVSKEPINTEVLKLIPESLARKRHIVAYAEDKDGIKVAMANPDDLELVQAIKKKTGKNVIAHLSSKEEINSSLAKYKKEIKEEFDQIIEESLKEAEGSGSSSPDLPIIKIVDTIVEYAYENKASDIHIEPHRKKMIVRFRIDGVLHDVIELPKEVSELIVMRVKIMSRLRTDEHRAAQDGKFSKSFHDERVDVRVSILPVSEGEKVVMRLLSGGSKSIGLKELGFEDEDLKKITAAYKRPYGMILATGPTGSGKTTTLYALLKLLNKREINIATIEDPVEYDLEGVNQIQVNVKTNLTFAAGLRSLLRQDPDVLMVGEIRDNETAGIAVNAAMTGHLVLSTLHTNDAPTALPRLLDMEVEPFLIASTVHIIIAQRLVRKICPKCLQSYVLKGKELEKLLKEMEAAGLDFESAVGKKNIKELNLYKGKGCKTCHESGYLGRLGIYELLEMKDNIKELIMKNANATEVREVAIANGMTTMFKDGVTKALKGQTTMEEILRVTRD